MTKTYLAKVTGDFPRVHAEVYRTVEDDGLTIDELVSARRFLFVSSAIRFVKQTIRDEGHNGGFYFYR